MAQHKYKEEAALALLDQDDEMGEAGGSADNRHSNTGKEGADSSSGTITRMLKNMAKIGPPPPPR